MLSTLTSEPTKPPFAPYQLKNHVLLGLLEQHDMGYEHSFVLLDFEFQIGFLDMLDKFAELDQVDCQNVLDWLYNLIDHL